MIRNIAVACLLACLCAWAAATLVRPPEVPFSKTMIDSGARDRKSVV
jgi:hypothetical protein